VIIIVPSHSSCYFLSERNSDGEIDEELIPRSAYMLVFRGTVITGQSYWFAVFATLRISW
jgi:hypothetical protein